MRGGGLGPGRPPPRFRSPARYALPKMERYLLLTSAALLRPMGSCVPSSRVTADALDAAVIDQIPFMDADEAVGLGGRLQLFHGHLHLGGLLLPLQVEKLVIPAALDIPDLPALQGEQPRAGLELDIVPPLILGAAFDIELHHGGDIVEEIGLSDRKSVV